LLLLDEPTSSLDMRHQLDLVETAKRRAQGGTAVIAVLHDLNLAMHFAGRVVLLQHGKVAIDGSPREVLTTEMIRRVFQVEAQIQYTDGGIPFLLPHTMRRTVISR
jgi:iron complex transport system ATP-binding protein